MLQFLWVRNWGALQSLLLAPALSWGCSHASSLGLSPICGSSQGTMKGGASSGSFHQRFGPCLGWAWGTDRPPPPPPLPPRPVLTERRGEQPGGRVVTSGDPMPSGYPGSDLGGQLQREARGKSSWEGVCQFRG